MFEEASRKRLRFESPQGLLTVEDLWQLPLQSMSGKHANLDGIAILISKALKDSSTESFVTQRLRTDISGPARADLELKLEIVKRVIKVRIQEAEAADKAAEIKAKKDRIMEIIAAKEDEALKGHRASTI
jgi:hypothetical protein